MKNKIRHLGLIPDGGGRWAIANGMSLRDGYMISMNLLFEFSNSFFIEDDRELSIYLFSMDNFKRKQYEIDALMETAEMFIERLIKVQNNWSLNIILAGQKHRLSEGVQKALNGICNSAKRTRIINLCLAYDPISEIQSNFLKHDNSQGLALLENLWVKTPIDLVLRTGGAVTLSKFLPLQASHARLIFLDALFNDLSIKNIFTHIEAHENLTLQYGD